MSTSVSRLAAGIAALLLAGGALACPNAKDKSVDSGPGSSASSTQTQTGGRG